MNVQAVDVSFNSYESGIIKRSNPVTLLPSRKDLIESSESLLTNRFLESIRKFDQLDPDTEAKNTKSAYLLLPIVEIYQDIEKIKTYIENSKEDRSYLDKATAIINNQKYGKTALKKLFNRYSDNIFYNDPRRANLYLAGGAMPSTRQTQQYLVRNEILTTLVNIKEDIEFLKLDLNDQQLADSIDDCREAIEAMKQYLNLADPEDVREATAILKGNELN